MDLEPLELVDTIVSFLYGLTNEHLSIVKLL